MIECADARPSTTARPNTKSNACTVEVCNSDVTPQKDGKLLVRIDNVYVGI